MAIFMALVALLWTLVGNPSHDLRTGSRGVTVQWVQRALDTDGAGLVTDGVYGPDTRSAVEKFQAANHLTADGVVGPLTAAVLVRANFPATVLPGTSSQAVRDLQTLLNDRGAHLARDGDFGVATKTAVRAFQVSRGLVSDGIAGPDTWGELADPVITVRTGDTLSSLSGPLGLSPRAVETANGLNGPTIDAGSRLILPVFTTSAGGNPATSSSSPNSSPPSATNGSKNVASNKASKPAKPSPPGAGQVRAWGGAGTASFALAFYGHPDPVLLQAAADLASPVTVFVTSPPKAWPKGLSIGVDALSGSAWRGAADAVGGGRTVYALTTPRRAVNGSVRAKNVVPVIALLVPGGSEASIRAAALKDAAGGEMVAIPLSGAGVRAGAEIVRTLRQGGYELETAAALVGP